MPHRTAQPAPNRPTRRHEPRDGHDIADIYEARLLAHGLRSSDFLALRSATDIPSIPDLRPLRFGRGTEHSPLQPIAVAAPEPIAETEPETPDDPDTESAPDTP